MDESFNKIRLRRLWEILKKETDEDHPMGTGTININSQICVAQTATQKPHIRPNWRQYLSA